MELAPYTVVEGVALAAYAIGAGEAFIAVRAEATETIRRLEAAIAAAEEAGFVGPDVLDSGWDLAIQVRPVQGAYMLGEETVLLKALEGKRGQPEQRPPHPTDAACSGDPRSSTTSRPWPPSRGSSGTAPRRSRRSARRQAPGRSSSRSGHRRAVGSPRSRSARRSGR